MCLRPWQRAREALFNCSTSRNCWEMCPRMFWPPTLSLPIYPIHQSAGLFIKPTVSCDSVLLDSFNGKDWKGLEKGLEKFHRTTEYHRLTMFFVVALYGQVPRHRIQYEDLGGHHISDRMQNPHVPTNAKSLGSCRSSLSSPSYLLRDFSKLSSKLSLVCASVTGGSWHWPGTLSYFWILCSLKSVQWIQMGQIHNSKARYKPFQGWGFLIFSSSQIAQSLSTHIGHPRTEAPRLPSPQTAFSGLKDTHCCLNSP